MSGGVFRIRINPSAYAFLWELYEATWDKDFVRIIHKANGSTAASAVRSLAANPGELYKPT